jgi:hypothetical protein
LGAEKSGLAKVWHVIGSPRVLRPLNEKDWDVDKRWKGEGDG